MGESASDAAGVDFMSFGQIGEAGFQRKSVGVEPVQERTLAEYTCIWVLAGVDMGIYVCC